MLLSHLAADDRHIAQENIIIYKHIFGQRLQQVADGRQEGAEGLRSHRQHVLEVLVLGKFFESNNLRFNFVLFLLGSGLDRIRNMGVGMVSDPVESGDKDVHSVGAITDLDVLGPRIGGTT